MGRRHERWRDIIVVGGGNREYEKREGVVREGKVLYNTKRCCWCWDGQGMLTVGAEDGDVGWEEVMVCGFRFRWKERRHKSQFR